MPSRTRIFVLQGSVLLLVLAIVLILRQNNHQLYRFKGRNNAVRHEFNKKGALSKSISNLTEEIPAAMLERKRLADVKEYFAKIKVNCF